MRQSTSEELNNSLQNQGYQPDKNDPTVYHRVTPSGVDKIFTDGDRSCKPDSNDWNKHQSGSNY